MSEFQCPNCGGNMEGDGYTIVFHCENVDCPMDVEPDADPIFCDFEEIEEGRQIELSLESAKGK